MHKIESNPKAGTRKTMSFLSFFSLFFSFILFSPVCFAGAFTFAGATNGVDIITHPQGYTGAGGVVTVSVCLDPTSQDAANPDVVTSIKNVVNTWNRLQPTTGNLVFGTNNNIPATAVDFESVVLHETGHCLGLAHPNAPTESGLTGNNRNFTKATKGVDGFFNLGSGADGIIGSNDDLRGDDVNLHWFTPHPTLTLQ